MAAKGGTGGIAEQHLAKTELSGARFRETQYCTTKFEFFPIFWVPSGERSHAMDFSSTHAALRSLKRRSTTSDALKILAEKLEGPFAGRCFGVTSL